MKYFCISDIHSYYNAMIASLNEAHFDKNNPEHILVVLGDLFDRGSSSLDVYNYIISLPKNRRILIQGNHECNYLKLLESKFPNSADFHNGTVQTFCEIANFDIRELNLSRQFLKYFGTEEHVNLWDIVTDNWNIVKSKVSKSPITKWLKSDEWINYFELDNFIITHSFIPTHVKDIDRKEIAIYNADMKNLSKIENWRKKATEKEWLNAKWGCPWKEYKAGLFDDEIKNNKILVCGHWSVSDFHTNLGKDKNKNNFDLYYDDNLIALDACTALSNECNVLIIDDSDFSCYDKYGNKLNINN